MAEISPQNKMIHDALALPLVRALEADPLALSRTVKFPVGGSVHIGESPGLWHEQHGRWPSMPGELAYDAYYGALSRFGRQTSGFVQLTWTGTLRTENSNAEIVSGGRTLIGTLGTGYTWDTDIVTNVEKRSHLIAGMLAPDPEMPPALWEEIAIPAAVAAGETALQRTSNTVLTLTLPAIPAYADAGTSGGANDGSLQGVCVPNVYTPFAFLDAALGLGLAEISINNDTD